jgi:hypothetical protein
VLNGIEPFIVASAVSIVNSTERERFIGRRRIRLRRGTNGRLGGFTIQRGCKMLTRDRRPDFRTMDRWAIGLLLEAGAIHKCDQHGWAKDRADPHAREEALRLAREEPLAGLSPDEGVAAVSHVLDSVGDTCPECD